MDEPREIPGDVTVEAWGKTFRLALGFKAMCAIERELKGPDGKGPTFLEFSRRLISGSALDLRLYTWAALRRHHPEITMEKAEDLIDVVGIDLISSKLLDLHMSTQPAKADLKVLGIDPSRPQPAQPAIETSGTGGPSMSRPDGSASAGSNATI